MTNEIITGLILVLALVGYLEYRNAPTEQALRSDPPVFQRPLACDAIVSQRGAGEQFVSRCYIKGNK